MSSYYASVATNILINEYMQYNAPIFSITLCHYISIWCSRSSCDTIINNINHSSIKCMLKAKKNYNDDINHKNCCISHRNPLSDLYHLKWSWTAWNCQYLQLEMESLIHSTFQSGVKDRLNFHHKWQHSHRYTTGEPPKRNSETCFTDKILYASKYYTRYSIKCYG